MCPPSPRAGLPASNHRAGKAGSCRPTRRATSSTPSSTAPRSRYPRRMCSNACASPATRRSPARLRNSGSGSKPTWRHLPRSSPRPIFPCRIEFSRRPPMDIQGLGYVGIRAKSLEDWTTFGTRFLGMQLVERSAKSLALRMDDRKQRVVVSEDGSEGVAFFGWEVADAAALNDFAARLQKAGIEVARGSRALADERRVKDLVVLADPLGNRLEIFHGAERASEPFKPGRSISGFRTGPLRIGHAVLHVKDINDALPFYRDVLGFRLSDYMVRPFKAYFFHANPRHHSIAFIETGRSATHHLMVELYSLDDVGQCYDLALGEEDRIGVTLGRHINDEVTSFYSNSPSGFMVEYRSEEHTSELQSQSNLVCRLLLEKKKKKITYKSLRRAQMT